MQIHWKIPWKIGMGQVHFSALGSGFGLWDPTRVGSRVNVFWFRVIKLCLGQVRVKFFLIFLVNFDWIWTHLWKKYFRVGKKFLQVARVHKKIARRGSGRPKWPVVGSNLGQVFTRPIPIGSVRISSTLLSSKVTIGSAWLLKFKICLQSRVQLNFFYLKFIIIAIAWHTKKTSKQKFCFFPNRVNSRFTMTANH